MAEAATEEAEPSTEGLREWRAFGQVEEPLGGLHPGHVGVGEVAQGVFEDRLATLVPRAPLTWLDGGNEFLWVSEKDGWRQIFRVARDGSSMVNITPGAYDVTRIRRIDTEGGRLNSSTPTEMLNASLSGAMNWTCVHQS